MICCWIDARRRNRGARMLAGGRTLDGGPYLYASTVLVDVEADAEAACEETFGPVVSLTPFDHVDDVEVHRESDDCPPANLPVMVGYGSADHTRYVDRLARLYGLMRRIPGFC